MAKLDGTVRSADAHQPVFLSSQWVAFTFVTWVLCYIITSLGLKKQKVHWRVEIGVRITFYLKPKIFDNQ